MSTPTGRRVPGERVDITVTRRSSSEGSHTKHTKWTMRVARTTPRADRRKIRMSLNHNIRKTKKMTNLMMEKSTMKENSDGEESEYSDMPE